MNMMQRFDEKFGVIEGGIIPFSEQYSADEFKDFIKSEFSSLRERVEGERKDINIHPIEMQLERMKRIGFNNAIDAVLRIIDETI